MTCRSKENFSHCTVKPTVGIRLVRVRQRAYRRDDAVRTVLYRNGRSAVMRNNKCSVCTQHRSFVLLNVGGGTCSWMGRSWASRDSRFARPWRSSVNIRALHIRWLPHWTAAAAGDATRCGGARASCGNRGVATRLTRKVDVSVHSTFARDRLWDWCRTSEIMEGLVGYEAKGCINFKVDCWFAEICRHTLGSLKFNENTPPEACQFKKEFDCVCSGEKTSVTHHIG